MKSCVNVIVNSDEILMRQIHPTFIQDGRITSSVFEPMKKDKGHLSCTAKSKITEEEAYRIYTKIKNLTSCGIARLSVHEINSIGLLAYFSPSNDGPTPDADKFDKAHSHIDFSQLSKSQAKTEAKKLADKARIKGVNLINNH